MAPARISDSEDEEQCWLLIETDKDFCVVKREAVHSSADVDVGDRVSFYWSASMELTGVVRCISDDDDECRVKARELVKESRQSRNTSFHVDKPRKAALSANQKLKSRPKSPTPSSHRKKLAEHQDTMTSKEILGQKGYVNNIVDSDKENSDSESSKEDEHDQNGDHGHGTTPSPPASPSALTQQFSFGKTPKSLPMKNNKLLKPHDSTRSLQQRGSSTPVNSERPFSFNSSQASVSAISTAPRDDSRKSKAIRIACHKVNAPNKFKGNMYRTDEYEPGAQNVYDTGVFCTEDDFLFAENASSATAVARRLLVGVFTHEAILSCSVSGLPPRGKGKRSYADASLIKPFLCPKAVHAIVCQALYWQKSKHFLKKRDDVQVRQAIQVRLNEIQNQKRKQEQQQLQV